MEEKQNKQNSYFILSSVEFDEVKKVYKSFFDKLNNETFENVSKKYKKLYSLVVSWIDNGKKFSGGAGVGRTPLQYWRNMLYGWYFEGLLFEFLKLNKQIKSVELFGTDKEHSVSVEGENIKISGIRTTKPDFKIGTSKNEWTIEVLTAAKGVYTIKEPKVQMAPKTYGEYGVYTYFIMFDIVRGEYSIVSPSFFVGKVAKPNGRMEGKLCFDFPVPHKKIKEILKEDFDLLIPQDDQNIIEKDWGAYKKLNNCKTPQEKKDLNKEIKIKRLEEQRKAINEDFDKKINKLRVH